MARNMHARRADALAGVSTPPRCCSRKGKRQRTVYLVSGEIELRVGDRTVSCCAQYAEARIAIGQGSRASRHADVRGTYVAVDFRPADG